MQACLRGQGSFMGLPQHTRSALRPSGPASQSLRGPTYGTCFSASALFTPAMISKWYGVCAWPAGRAQDSHLFCVTAYASLSPVNHAEEQGWM